VHLIGNFAGNSEVMTMNDKATALRFAQSGANILRAPVALLNLNPFCPLYVVRKWDDRFNGHRDLVAKIEPKVQ